MQTLPIKHQNITVIIVIMLMQFSSKYIMPKRMYIQEEAGTNAVSRDHVM